MKTVFILEDSKVQANRLKKLLEDNGCEVVGWARTGEKAVGEILELRPNLVFIDVILEGEVDGISVAEEIRRQLDVPIIFTTNYSNREYVDRAIQVSPYAYMLKPIDEDQLRVTLEITGNRVQLEKDKLKLTQELYQSQKMEAIGRLAGGIAHNFNNMLSVIIGSAESALKYTEKDAPNRERIERIVRAGLGAREMSMKMLALTRREKTDYSTFFVGKVIEDVCDILGESAGKNIEICADFRGEPVKVKGDPNQVMQALLNVCMNACDSMENGGTVTISTAGIELDDKAALFAPGMNPGKYCHIRVSDTGCGMPEDVREKVFEPFFTTKEKEKGTGLGLYVTLGIIQAHGGGIDIAGGDNGGTTVDIYFPLCEEEAPEEERPAAHSASAADETILVVDDESDFIDTLTEMLEMEGYRTYSAGNGATALQIFQKHSSEIDLVLLDIMMPGMEGDSVYRKLREIDPDVKVILCSGYSVEGKVGSLMEQGARAFIQKPFVLPELRQAISDVLSV